MNPLPYRILLLTAALLPAPALFAQTWQSLSGQISGTPAGSGPQPFSGNTWFAGTTTGDYRSTDNGVSWTNVSGNLLDPWNRIITATFYFRASTGRLFRVGNNASWDNRTGSPVWYSDNDGGTWTEVALPFGSNAPAGIGFTAMTEHAGALFAADQLSQGVWKSTDNGLTWTASRNGIPTTMSWPFQATVLSSVTSTADAVFATGPTTGIYRSTDGGNNWTAANNGLPSVSARDIVALSDGTLFAAVGDNHLCRSTDGGNSWTNVSQLLGQGNIRSLTADGTRIYAFTSSQNLLESTDGGSSFSRIDGGTPPPYLGSNLRQLSLGGNTLIYSSGSHFHRLDLSSATRSAIVPAITSQPLGKGVNTGGSVSFSVTHSNATQPISYQWKRGNDVIPGANGPTFTLSSATLSDAGDYTVTVSNAAGPVTSQTATLTVAPDTPGSIDYTFQPYMIGGGSLRNIYSVAYGLDGSMYAAGEFLNATNGTPGRRILRIRPDGTVDPSFAPDTGSFNSEIGLAVLPLPDGSVLAGGGSRSSLTTLAWRKLGPDGKVDPAFNWPVELSGPTDCVIHGPDGTAYVSGSYGIYRIFTATGEIDHTFNPPTFHSSPRIRKIALAPDGKIYVAGGFNSVNGRSLVRIARLHPDGTLDISFSTGSGGSNGFNQDPTGLAVQADGKPVVTGQFTTYRGAAAQKVARLNTDGSLDTSFSPPAFNLDVNAVTLDGQGHLIVGGAFTTVAGAGRNNIARLSPVDGSLDSNFPGNSQNLVVNALETLPDGRILVGSNGQFFRLLAAPSSVARISFLSQDTSAAIGQSTTLAVQLAGPSSGATYQWHKEGSPIAGATASTFHVPSVSHADSGAYHVEVNVGGDILISPSRRIDALGAPVVIRQPQTGTGHLGTRHLLSVKASGAGPLTYQWLKNGQPVSGATFAGQFFNQLSPADAGNWSVRITNSQGSVETTPFHLSVQPRPGTPDPSFVFSAPAGTTVAGRPTCIHRLPDGRYLAGGTFTLTIGGTMTQHHLLRLFSDGTIDLSFSLAASPLAGEVRWLAGQAGGKIIVGGNAVPIRLNADLTPDPAFTPPSFGSGQERIYALKVLSSGKIIVQSASALAGYPSGLVRLNADGTLDTSFPSHSIMRLSSSAYVTAVDEDGEGRVLLAGAFNTFGSHTRNSIVRLEKDSGSVDQSFAGPAPIGVQQGGVPAIFMVSSAPDGSIYIGGDFGDVGNVPARGLARLSGTDGSHDPTFYPTQTPGINYFAYAIDYLPDGRLAVGSVRSLASNGGHAAFDVRWPNGSFDSRSAPTETTSTFSTTGSLTGTGDGRHFLTARNLYFGRIFTGETPLAFTSVPAAVTANFGSSVTLTAAASGTTAISYQWKKNGQVVPGATQASLTLPSLQRSDEAAYTLEATNGSGTIASPPAYLNVLAEPEITADPVRTTVAYGQSVTLSVAAKGRPTLAYSWQKDGVTVPNLAGKTSGATTATLTLTGISESEAGSYRAVVTNNLGTTYSAIADVVVTSSPGALDGSWIDPAPFVTNSSANLSRLMPTPGGGFILSGNITGFTGSNTHRYAGRYSAAGVRDTTFAPGTTVNFGSNYTRWAVDPSGGLYAVNWSPSLASSILYRFGPTGTPVGAATLPAIAQDLYFEADGKLIVAFATNASGKMVRRYTLDSVANTATEDPTFNAWINNHVYGVYPSPSTGGYYITGGFTKIKDGAGTEHTRAMLARLNPDGTLDTGFNFDTSGQPGYTLYQRPFVIEAPDGKVHFRNLRLASGGQRDGTWNETTVNIAAHRGIFAPDGKLLVTGGSSTVNTVVRLLANGDRDTTFNAPVVSGTIHDIVRTESGSYYAAGSFSGSTATANRPNIIRLLDESADIGFTAAPTDITVGSGQSASFAAAAYGAGLTFRWYHNGSLVSDGGRYNGAGTANLMITGTTVADTGSLRLEISNVAGTRSRTAFLTVTPPASAGFADWDALGNVPANQRGPLDTPDGDGIPNLVKYALGLTPGTPSGSATAATSASVSGTTYPAITFKRRKNIPDVGIEVLASSDLPVVGSIPTELVSVTDNGDGTETVVVRTTVPVSATPRQFLSVKVTGL